MEKIVWEVWRGEVWADMGLVLELEMGTDMALAREIELRNDYHMQS
jgi:hypothetical protein